MTDHQQPLTETQALAWLHGQPDGTITTTVSDLARAWGWNRSTTSRRVKAWVTSGQIVRTPGPDGRSVFTARTADVPQACDTPDVPASPSAKSLVIPTVSLAVQSAAQGEHPRSGSCNTSDRRLPESESRVPRASCVALAATLEAGWWLLARCSGRDVAGPNCASISTLL
jgi:hypothetical protein